MSDPIRLYRVGSGGGATQVQHQLSRGDALGIQVECVTSRGTRLRLLDPLFRLCHEEGIPGQGPGGFVFEFSEQAQPGRYRVLLEHGEVLAVREFELLAGEQYSDRLSLHQSVRLGGGQVNGLELYLSLPPAMALHQRLRDLEPTHPTPRVTDLVGNEWLRLGPVDLREPLTFGYDARLQMCGFSVDRAALVDPPVRDEVVYRRYLEPEQGIESDHPEIRQLAESLAGETVAEQSEAAYHEVKRRISYKLQRAEYGALAGLRRGEGDCTEISALYAALLRARGIPARVAIGMYAGSRDLHAVVELYHRGLWIPVDITNHAQPFYGLPADFVILLRANWMSTRAVEKQLSYSYRASTPDALEVTESLLLRGEARRKVCVASENGEKSSVVRQVRFTSQTMGVSIEQGRRHPLRGALYLFWDDRSPHINWIAPVSLPPGRPTEVDLPEDRFVPFPGPSGGVRIGFVDTHDNMQVEAPY